MFDMPPNSNRSPDEQLEYVTVARKVSVESRKTYHLGWLLLFFAVGFIVGHGARLFIPCI